MSQPGVGGTVLTQDIQAGQTVSNRGSGSWNRMQRIERLHQLRPRTLKTSTFTRKRRTGQTTTQTAFLTAPISRRRS
jgi:hypothetical protein